MLGEGERLVQMLGPVLVDATVMESKADLKEQLSVLKDEEFDFAIPIERIGSN